MLPRRELMTQIARLAGAGSFEERFGSAQTATPTSDALASFVEKHLEPIAASLVSEAAASDDVTDQTSAAVFLEDRIATLDDLLMPSQADRIRELFHQDIADW